MLSFCYLDEKQPAPARLMMYTPHVKNTVSDEAGNNVSQTHGRPEETQPQRQLMMLVKVGKI